MGKNKLAKFAEMESFPHVFQVSSHDILSGKVFVNKGLISKERACGPGRKHLLRER